MPALGFQANDEFCPPKLFEVGCLVIPRREANNCHQQLQKGQPRTALSAYEHLGTPITATLTVINISLHWRPNLWKTQNTTLMDVNRPHRPDHTQRHNARQRPHRKNARHPHSRTADYGTRDKDSRLRNSRKLPLTSTPKIVTQQDVRCSAPGKGSHHSRRCLLCPQ